MQILLISILLIIIVYFSSSIFSVISSVKTNSNDKITIGNKWFFTLLFINITLIIFICVFYYQKSQAIGKKGAKGLPGFNGQSGYGCTFPDSNGICK